MVCFFPIWLRWTIAFFWNKSPKQSLCYTNSMATTYFGKPGLCPFFGSYVNEDHTTNDEVIWSRNAFIKKTSFNTVHFVNSKTLSNNIHGTYSVIVCVTQENMYAYVRCIESLLSLTQPQLCRGIASHKRVFRVVLDGEKTTVAPRTIRSLVNENVFSYITAC